MNKQLNLNQIASKGVNYFAAFGGYFAGKLINKTINNVVVSRISQVQGLGLTADSLPMKLISPVVLIGGAAIVNMKSKNEWLKYGSIGLGVCGAEEAIKVVTNKASLFGVSLGDILANTNESNYQLPVNINLDLPELKEEARVEYKDLNLTGSEESQDDYFEIAS